ncbi:amidase [Alkalibacillus haloalkaliphilus]|uniref:amidase n=1 Tax=Alkalibacillus haloalkaliphilus TaxID=94136 RepID=UPI00293583D4|nr:amidase [Alkalibacillus haloalkaliphilus]MDV2581969.1 amidase [Alkalibacillus haloalkaliphilus]
MKDLNELNKCDALAQKDLIDRGEVLVSEMTSYYIDRIKMLNPILNAVVHPMFDQASAQANEKQAVDHPLAGLPFLVKDLNPIANEPFTNGSKLQESFVAKEDDVFVQRYREAGLNFLGKTNTPEFGFLPITEPELHGPANNPWDLTRSPGGSSGGSAAAVAAGMVPFAHANDGGGSIRMPASACGLFGFKPSRGQLPISPYINQISVNHAVTRSVRDSAALLDVIKGGTDLELYPTYETKQTFLTSTQEEPKALRIGVTPDWNEQVTIDEETKKAFDQMVKLLSDLGHEVEEVTVPMSFNSYTENFIKIWAGSGAVAIDHLSKMTGQEPSMDNLEALSYEIYKAGKQMTAFDYEEARVMLQLESKKFLSLYGQYDLLLTPVLNRVPVKTGELKQESIEALTNNMVSYCSFTPIANATGQPAMSVPGYWTDNNVPIGMQFKANVGEDHLLFQLASQIESANSWFYKYEELDERLIQNAK